MARWSSAAVLLLFCAVSPAPAQDSAAVQDSAPGWSLDLGFRGYGLSIGNSVRWNGIRLNFSDRGVLAVNGLNLTFGAPKENPRAVFNGAAVGLAPVGKSFRGLTFGLVGAVAHRSFDGVSLAGLGLVSNGTMKGVNLSGLGAVADGDMVGLNLVGLGTVAKGRLTGLNVAGLGIVAQEDMVGINLAGLGAVSQGRMWGTNAAGLAAVSEGSMVGLNFAGLGLVAEAGMTGLNFGGVAVVAGDRMTGLNLAGVAVVAKQQIGISLAGVAVVAEEQVRGAAVAGVAVVAGDGPIQGLTVTLGTVKSSRMISGFAFAGYRVEAPQVQGWVVPLATLQAGRLEGVSLSAYNRVSGIQRGLAIGLVNYARELHGFQVGVVNVAGNNRGIARVLPILNLHVK